MKAMEDVSYKKLVTSSVLNVIYNGCKDPVSLNLM